MLSIAITALAGNKKCYKKTFISENHQEAIQQKNNGSNSIDLLKANKEICIGFTCTIQHEKGEELLTFRTVRKQHDAYKFFWLSNYTNPPFAPPDKEFDID